MDGTDNIAKQHSWLAKQMEESGSGAPSCTAAAADSSCGAATAPSGGAAASAEEQQRKPNLEMRRKLKGAMLAVKLVNKQQRRLPGGARRHSVAYGVQIETRDAAKTPAGSFNTYLSSRAQEFFEHKYAALGRWIGTKPRLAMLLGTLVLASGLPGSFMLLGEANVLWIKFDTRMYESFAMPYPYPYPYP